MSRVMRKEVPKTHSRIPRKHIRIFVSFLNFDRQQVSSRCQRDKNLLDRSTRCRDCNKKNLEAQQIVSIEVSIKVTGIQIFISDFRPMLIYLCRVSFLTILKIYKAYFRGRHIKRIQGEHMQKVTDALFSLKEATASLRLRVL